MSRVRSCPSRAELNECLSPISNASLDLENHIAACPSCQSALQEIAAEPTWWEDAGELLTVAVDPAAERIAHSVCAMSGEVAEEFQRDPQRAHELARLQEILEPASHPELLGRIGRYEVEELVGQGGMGLVFRGRDTELHRIVAVKTIASHLSPLGPARERFAREARACASLTHPHIVAVHDIVTDGPVPAIVMQYIAGPTLQQVLTEDGPLPWKRVLTLAIQLCDALETAHASGLIHRDIKPGNVLLEAGGSRAMLTDFGLVRALDDGSLTRTGTLAGTPDFMSPEQSWGHELDCRSDLFSLGSLLYTMLSGQPPFRAPEPMATLHRICNDRHRPLSELVPELPREISQLVDRLLAKQPRKRFSSAAELRDTMHQLSRSDLVLQQPKHRRQARLIGGGIALVAFALILTPLVQWSLSPATTRQDSEWRGRVSRSTIPSSYPPPASSLATSFEEFHGTDRVLQQWEARAARLERQFSWPMVAEIDTQDLHSQAVDRELEMLRQSLSRIEADDATQ